MGIAPHPPAAEKQAVGGGGGGGGSPRMHMQTAMGVSARRASFSAQLPPDEPAYPSLQGYGSAAARSGHSISFKHASEEVTDPNVSSTIKTQSWDARNITLTHKYTDPVLVDINITNAGEA
jgi:hypothetical protein